MEHKDFEQLAQRLRPGLLKVGRDFFGNADDAEDVAQETLLRLWAICSDLRPDTVEALAGRVARNYCVSVWRKRQHEVTAGTNPPDRPHWETPDTALQDTENRRLVKLAVKQLTPSQRRILEMRAESEMKTSEIARVLGLKPESVSAILSSARRTLYQALRKMTER